MINANNQSLSSSSSLSSNGHLLLLNVLKYLQDYDLVSTPLSYNIQKLYTSKSKVKSLSFLKREY